jgi:hypothetical protein
MVEPTGSSSNICSSRAENVDVSNYELLVGDEGLEPPTLSV